MRAVMPSLKKGVNAMIRAVLFDVGGTLHQVHASPELAIQFSRLLLDRLAAAGIQLPIDAQALAAHQVPFELHVYPYGGHGMATVDEQTNDGLTPGAMHAAAWIGGAKKWLRLTFGREGSLL